MNQGQPTDLATVLARGGPMEPARAVDLVCQLAAAVDHSHAHQSAHRDVSPATILLSGDGRAHLADAGTTRSGLYRAPELQGNTEASYRADIYALTGVLYECLTGSPPAPPMPARPSARRPGIPPGFDDVIARGMAEHPGHRFRSATELAEAARRALTGGRHDVPSNRLTTPGPVPPGPGWDPRLGIGPTMTFPHTRPPLVPHPPPKRRRRVAVAVGALLAVAALTGAAAIVLPRLAHHAPSPPAQHTYSSQPTALPFTALKHVKRLAADAGGNLYVLSSVAPAPGQSPDDMYQLSVLSRGAANPDTKDLPGVDVRLATDAVTDAAGSLYVSDGKNVWESAGGTAIPVRLPFRGFVNIEAIAVDAAGNAYAAGALASSGSSVRYGIRKLAPGANGPTDLPFTDLFLPHAVAVDKAGNLFVGDTIKGSGKGRVRKLPPNADTPIQLSFPDLLEASQFALDSNGNLFVADGWQKTSGVYQLPAGAGTATKLPVSVRASAVAVDAAADLYIGVSAATTTNGRVVKTGQVLKLTPDK